MKYSKPWYLQAMLALAFLATSASFTTHEARAQSLIDATNPQGILEIAKGYGSADLTTDDDGDPKITGNIEWEGLNYIVWFYGCSDGRNCKALRFSMGWIGYDPVSLSDISRWNRTRPFAKLYLDDYGNPFLEMDVNLHGGVSRENLNDTFGWWKTLLVEFRDKIDP